MKGYKSRDDPVEGGALVAVAALVRAQAPEVLDRFGGDVGPEHDDDSTQGILSSRHVQIHLGVLFCLFARRLPTLQKTIVNKSRISITR